MDLLFLFFLILLALVVVIGIGILICKIRNRAILRILQLISDGQDITIRACDGKRTIAQANQVFTDYIDSNFKNWDLDKPGKATPAIKAKVYELCQNTRFKQIFKFLSSDLDKLCLTQDQIIAFVEDHIDCLQTKDSHATLFLFKENKSYFVVSVYSVPSGKLKVYVDKLKAAYVWYAYSRHRVVASVTVDS